MIRGIPAAEYPLHRDAVLPFLKNFAQRDLDGLTVEEIEAGILGRERQVWCINDFQALALTYLTPLSVRISHCAGVRRHEWQDALDDELRAWAKALGKKRIVATVRPGWARFGRARGYRETHRQMRLEI